LIVSTSGCTGIRLIIDVARGAQAALVISHVAAGPARVSLGIEADLGDGATLHIDELQLGDTAQLFSLAWPRLARDATLSWCSVGVGGDCVRQRIKGTLSGANASLNLTGLSVVGGTRQAHHYLRVMHQVGHTRSQQTYKTIAGGKAIASFDGLIAMAKGADRSEAEQTNHNLLLSAGARVDTRPQLDILADDVKAAHGATVGQIDAEELFYLRARGLPSTQARTLLIQGFAVEILERIHNPGARDLATRLVAATLHSIA
jgi:Fe-S cluster assembly protein SufD